MKNIYRKLKQLAQIEATVELSSEGNNDIKATVTIRSYNGWRHML